MKENKAFQHLYSIPSRTMSSRDLTEESKRKVVDTTKYAMEHNNETDQTAVLMRCCCATLAEQYVAEWMQGFCLHGDENLNDPWTYSFDVLAGPEYYGVRIEVKTQQSGAKYISVNTGTAEPYKGDTGLNIRPFLEHGIADLIIVFRTTHKQDGSWLFEPFVTCDRAALKSPAVVKKSNFKGYYLTNSPEWDKIKNLNIFYPKHLQPD